MARSERLTAEGYRGFVVSLDQAPFHQQDADNVEELVRRLCEHDPMPWLILPRGRDLTDEEQDRRVTATNLASNFLGMLKVSYTIAMHRKSPTIVLLIVA